MRSDTTPSEGLLTALDGCLDAVLSGGGAAGQDAYPGIGAELEPLLAVACQLMRSRGAIDARLAPWRSRLPVIEDAVGPSDAFVNAARWPGLN